jgi:CRISPR/Cas system CMR subunit Cmr6 (Cas7 group RAMP superfamily)
VKVNPFYANLILDRKAVPAISGNEVKGIFRHFISASLITESSKLFSNMTQFELK